MHGMEVNIGVAHFHKPGVSAERKLSASNMNDAYVIKRHPFLIQAGQCGKCTVHLAKVSEQHGDRRRFSLYNERPVLMYQANEDAYSHALRYRSQLIFPVHYFL